MLAIRWIEMCGGRTTQEMAKFELSPGRQVSAEAVVGLETHVWQARYGLLIDTDKTPLVRAYADDINSWVIDGKIIPDELCANVDYVDTWGEVEGMVKDYECKHTVPECVVEKPAYKAVIVVGHRKHENNTMEKAVELARIMDLPLYIMETLYVPNSKDE